MYRVVVDTNVWVSGLLWGGGPGRIITLAAQGRLSIWASVALLQELHEVLAEPHLVARQRVLGVDVAGLITYVTGLVTLIDVREVQAVVAADPDDDQIVACATTAQVAYIISGDRHLRALQQVQGIPILTPQAFLEQVFPEGNAAA